MCMGTAASFFLGRIVYACQLPQMVHPACSTTGSRRLVIPKVEAHTRAPRLRLALVKPKQEHWLSPGSRPE